MDVTTDVVGRTLAEGTGDQELQVRAAREFEAFLLKMMLSEMRRTVGEGGLLGNGHATKTYEAMLDDALASRAAEAGSFGLARQLLQQWESAR